MAVTTTRKGLRKMAEKPMGFRVEGNRGLVIKNCTFYPLPLGRTERFARWLVTPEHQTMWDFLNKPESKGIHHAQ